MQVSGLLNVNGNVSSTSPSTGALVVFAGYFSFIFSEEDEKLKHGLNFWIGVGIGGSLYVGGKYTPNKLYKSTVSHY